MNEKIEVFNQEKEKLDEIFKNIDDSKKQLVEGLIHEAAFLYAENCIIRDLINDTGMVKVHPSNPFLQKQTEAGKQYLKNINAYANVIKALASAFGKTTNDNEDEFDKWVKAKREELESMKSNV